VTHPSQRRRGERRDKNNQCRHFRLVHRETGLPSNTPSLDGLRNSRAGSAGQHG
jgi:hypothetical protein